MKLNYRAWIFGFSTRDLDSGGALLYNSRKSFSISFRRDIHFQLVSYTFTFGNLKLDVPSSRKVSWVGECYFLEILLVSARKVKLSVNPTANSTADDALTLCESKCPLLLGKSNKTPMSSRALILIIGWLLKV